MGTLIALGIAVSGCCIDPPPAEKFFDRREHPIDTLKGFVYAVDTHQWDYAYECLDADSKEKLGGRLRFEVAIRFLDVEIPEGDGVVEPALYDLISSALHRVGRDDFEVAGENARTLIHSLVTTLDVPTMFQVALYFRREEGDWKIAFLQSLRGV